VKIQPFKVKIHSTGEMLMSRPIRVFLRSWIITVFFLAVSCESGVLRYLSNGCDRMVFQIIEMFFLNR